MADRNAPMNSIGAVSRCDLTAEVAVIYAIFSLVAASGVLMIGVVTVAQFDRWGFDIRAAHWLPVALQHRPRQFAGYRHPYRVGIPFVTGLPAMESGDSLGF